MPGGWPTPAASDHAHWRHPLDCGHTLASVAQGTDAQPITYFALGNERNSSVRTAEFVRTAERVRQLPNQITGKPTCGFGQLPLTLYICFFLVEIILAASLAQ